MIRLDIEKSLFGARGEMLLTLSLDIANGEILAVTGESGSGKTTLLRVLAGLESARGRIEVDGEIWLDGEISIPPQKREIGFVFQNYALFPNMTLEENLLFVKNDRELARYLLEITELYPLRGRYPDSISGGQRQRVAISRALMRRPKVLLMDEPLSALDPKMRIRLQRQILKLHREFKTTTLIVSHDPEEIYNLADRVAVLDSGKLIKVGEVNSTLSKDIGSPLRGKLLSVERGVDGYIATILSGNSIIEVDIDMDML
ncbi:MAG: ATP-binding cassette domain-containing protein [Epsilonproteobacteria bacterium]|nr:ATP-binding cassette domain-containing protein [Campylobacterota bacterium]